MLRDHKVQGRLSVLSGIQNLESKLGILLTALLVMVLIGGLFGRYAFDDSYVGYTYARNLANGSGFHYNLHSPELLATSAPLAVPLYALSAVVLHLDVVVVAQIYSSIALALIAASVFLLCYKKNTPWTGFIGAAALITSPFLLPLWSHETLLYLAFAITGYTLLIRKSYYASATVTGLAALFRGEALLLIPLAAVLLLIEKKSKKLVLSVVGIALVPYILWAIVAQKLFGTPFSSTIHSKAAQGSFAEVDPYLVGLFDYIHKIYAVSLINHAGYLQMGFFVALILLCIKEKYFSTKHVFLFVWALLVTLVYVALKLPFYFWFSTQIGLIQTSLVVSPWMKISGDKKSLVFRNIARAVSILILTINIATGLFFALGQKKFDLNYFIVMPQLSNNAYRSVGEWIKDNTPPNAVIMASEFAQVRYYSQRDVLDPLGIITPGAATRLREDNGIWAVEKYQPSYIILGPDLKFFLDPISNDWFENAYRLKMEFSSASYAYDPMRSHMLLFEKSHSQMIPSARDILQHVSTKVASTKNTLLISFPPVSAARFEVLFSTPHPCSTKIGITAFNPHNRLILSKNEYVTDSVTRILIENPGLQPLNSIVMRGCSGKIAAQRTMRYEEKVHGPIQVSPPTIDAFR